MIVSRYPEYNFLQIILHLSRKPMFQSVFFEAFFRFILSMKKKKKIDIRHFLPLVR